MPNQPCAYDVQMSEIMITHNTQLVMLPTIHLKDEMEPNHVPTKLVNFSNESLHVGKHVILGTLHLYTV